MQQVGGVNGDAKMEAPSMDVRGMRESTGLRKDCVYCLF